MTGRLSDLASSSMAWMPCSVAVIRVFNEDEAGPLRLPGIAMKMSYPFAMKSSCPYAIRMLCLFSMRHGNPLISMVTCTSIHVTSHIHNSQPIIVSSMTNPSNPKRRSKYSFVRFMDGVITQLQRNGQYKSWQHYRSTLNSLMRFRGNQDFSLRKLDAVMMESYEVYLRQQGVCRNTSSFYMRILRAVYNRAADQGLIVRQHPFRRVYTGIDKTRKRAIPFENIRQISRLDFRHLSPRDMAKDAFMLSFYLRGISFIDLAHLKKSDIRNGYLHYNRSKTHQRITIKWEPRMQKLVDKYQHLAVDTPYLLPFLCESGCRTMAAEQLYRNVEARITYHLRKIGHMVGMQGNLTLYVARHSWATAAKAHRVPISVISEALGHDSESTTQIYLRSIQTSDVDRLNAEMLAEL